MSDHHFLHPTREPARSLGARLFLPAALLVSVTTLPATTGGGSSSAPITTTFPGATSPSGQWPYPNGDLANTREAPGSLISSSNVSGLREAWAFTLAGTAAAGVSPYGSLTAAPVVSDGVVYLQDQDANVYALALATGQLMWEYQVNVPEASGPGPDGVAVTGGHGVRRHVDVGLCPQRCDRQADMGGQQFAEHRPRGVRDPAAGGRRAGLPGQRVRVGPAAGC